MNSRRSQSGWTLIELLLATVIAVLVIALLLSAYHTTITATRHQKARERQGKAAHSLLQLSRDLQCAYLSDKMTNSFMTLTAGDGFALSFTTLIPDPNESDLRWTDLVAVTYRTETNAGKTALVRIASPLIGPEAYTDPATNVLVSGFASASVRLFDGEDWVDTWPVDDDTPVLPKAARLTLKPAQSSGEPPLQTEVFIPSGSIVSPDVTRSSTIAP